MIDPNDAQNREREWRPATRAVRGGTRRSSHGETSEAVFLNSGFSYDSAETAAARFAGEAEGFVYSRFGNPTVAMFERRLALIEGAEACAATASGMAAVFAALMCQLKAGDRVVAARVLFGSCFYICSQLLPRYGIEVEFVDGADLDQWRQALARDTRCVFFETPANPTLELVDIAAVSALAHEAGACVIIDNALASPHLQNPIDHGADLVVYSATKHIDGQGRCLGGAVLGGETFCNDVLRLFLRHTGPAMSPFNAWVMLKGLETLELRVERMCANAAKVAASLAGRPAVARVLYPFADDHPQIALAKRQMRAGGSLVSFHLDGGRAEAFKFVNALELVDISNNLGDAKSLITHPASSTHASMPAEQRDRLGITEGLVRLSVGLEDPHDLIADLAAALDGLA